MTTLMHTQHSSRTVGTPRKHRGLFVRAGIVGIAMAASFAAIAGPASAAPGDTSGQATVAHVAVTSGITMTGLTPSFTLTGAPGATVSGPAAVTFNVETNNVAGYAVTVQSTTATMDPALGGNLDTIPIADLTVRETGGGAYTPVSDLTTVTVHTQPGRSANGGDALSNDFQIRVPVVNADTYSATLDYVATTL